VEDRGVGGRRGSARVSAGTRESLTLHLTQLNSTSQMANWLCSNEHLPGRAHLRHVAEGGAPLLGSPQRTPRRRRR